MGGGCKGRERRRLVQAGHIGRSQGWLPAHRYRMSLYKVEGAIRDAIRESGLPHENVFVTTKMYVLPHSGWTRHFADFVLTMDQDRTSTMQRRMWKVAELESCRAEDRLCGHVAYALAGRFQA